MNHINDLFHIIGVFVKNDVSNRSWPAPSVSTIDGNLTIPGCTVACWETEHIIKFQRQ